MGKPGKIQRSGKQGSAASGLRNTRVPRATEARSQHSGARANEGLTPQTCCSNCQTVFEVSLDLLSSSDTRVRCGECLSVFDALANLRDLSDQGDFSLSDTQAAILHNLTGATPAYGSNNQTNAPDAPHDVSSALLAGLANDTGSLDVTYSDFDLFSTDAGLPDVQFLDNTRDTPRFHFDDFSDNDDETFNDTLFAQDVTVDARSTMRGRSNLGLGEGIDIGNDIGFITDDTQLEPLIFEYQDPEPPVAEIPFKRSEAQQSKVNDSFDEDLSNYDQAVDTRTYTGVDRDLEVPAEPAASNPWFMRSFLFFIVLVLAGSLYAYRERTQLLNNSYVRPALESMCETLSCQLPPRYNLSALRAVERSVVSHPTIESALVIRFGIVNEASFGQPYPVLEIRLSDMAGRLVVTNRFLPSEYQRGWQEGDVLDAQKRLDIGLAVQDPGNTAISFELDFHKVK